MCHQLNLSFVDIKFKVESDNIHIHSTVKTKEATGVEMEALTAVSVTALTIYDMCKAVDKNMEIREVRLIEKKGGKSDHATKYRPKVGVITLSDGVASGKKTMYREEYWQKVFRFWMFSQKPNCSGGWLGSIGSTIRDWVNSGIELILTTGGTGLGPEI